MPTSGAGSNARWNAWPLPRNSMPMAIGHSRIAIPWTLPQLARLGARSLVYDPFPSLAGALSDLLGVAQIEFFRAARYGLLQALRELDPQRVEVLTPAFGCPIVPAVIHAAGRVPVLADIDPVRFSVRSDELEAKRSARTGAVILVHEFGNPVPPVLFDRARSSGAICIEDAAIALGARDETGYVGTHGDIVLLSAGLGKPVSGYTLGVVGRRRAVTRAPNPVRDTSSGVWGALQVIAARIAAQPLVYGYIERLVRQAADEASDLDPDGDAVPLGRFDGRAMLTALRALDEQRRRRAAIAQSLLAVFRGHGWETLDCGGGEPMFARVPAYVPRGRDRSDCIAVFRRHGVELGTPYRRSLLELPGVVARGSFEATRDALERLVCVTINPAARNAAALPEAVESALRDFGGTAAR